MSETIHLKPKPFWKRTFTTNLRFLLLMPFNCKWNVWVRDFTAEIEWQWKIIKQRGRKS